MMHRFVRTRRLRFSVSLLLVLGSVITGYACDEAVDSQVDTTETGTATETAMETATQPSHVYEPEGRLTSGPQIILVIVGAKSCAACSRDEFAPAIETLKLNALDASRSASRSYMVVGAAVDGRPSDGLALLEGLGAFDQIAVGGSWLNMAAVRYVWETFPGEPTIPQVIVLERDIEMNESGIRVADERLLTRLVGIDEILDAAQEGMRLQIDE